MTKTEALITAARRYCQDNHSYWANKYSKERTGKDFPYTYTDNDYNMFPRYNVLSAILDSVETLVGYTYHDIENCKDDLKKFGLISNNIFTTTEHNNIALNAMQEERKKFITFIAKTANEDLTSIEELPYRRRLHKEESEHVRQALLEKWNFEGNHWEPLEELSPKPTIFLMKEYYSQ